jgi:hypothetical protein
MMIPQAHQLHHQSSPFIDSGVHLDLLTRSPSNVQQLHHEADDDVFLQDSPTDEAQVFTSLSSIDSTSSSNTVVMDQTNAPNGLARSRRSHFSRKDSTPEMANKPKTENEQRIIHTIKSLWWFYQNLPLCKNLPLDFDVIREKCPNIVRDKVIDLNNNNGMTNINFANRIAYKCGSGRILKKSFSSFSAFHSKSFDETVESLCDTNNNNHKAIRRTSSTLNLSNVKFVNQATKMMVNREA